MNLRTVFLISLILSLILISCGDNLDEMDGMASTNEPDTIICQICTQTVCGIAECIPQLSREVCGEDEIQELLDNSNGQMFWTCE